MEVKLDEDANVGEAVSPIGQVLSTPFLSLCVHAIFELEQNMDVLTAKNFIKDIFLPAANYRFCSIMGEDQHGVLRWIKTKVNVDDHLIIPEFPPDKTEYDDFVKDYICNIHLTPLPVNRPLWQFHLLNYNTSKARATLILNIHHSLGDGTSLMSLCLCCATRADDPNLPLTFPSSKSLPTNVPPPLLSIKFMYSMLQRLFVLVLVLWYTVSDFTRTVLRTSMLLNDSKLPIRGPPGVLEMLPKVMSHVTFQMEDIKKIKNSVGGTVNDVIMGVIFYGFHRYLQLTHFHGGDGKEMRKSRVTGLVTINTRALSGFKDTKDMMKPESRVPWGNHAGFLHVPMLTANGESPLDYVRGAKKIMDKKKMSREVHFTCRLLNYMGREVFSKLLYEVLTNTTLTITQMIGPMEKIAFNQVPVKNMFFSVSGFPQTLILTLVSYMGKLRLDVIGVKGYIDCDMLAKSFEHCFEEIKEASNSL